MMKSFNKNDFIIKNDDYKFLDNTRMNAYFKDYHQRIDNHIVDRLILGRRFDLAQYHKKTVSTEHNNKWIVLNPDKWTQEENIAFCAAGIALKKNFKIVTPLDDIVSRAAKHKKHPLSLKRYGIGGTVPEILWLRDNHYEFIEKIENGKTIMIAKPTSKTPTAPIINYNYLKETRHLDAISQIEEFNNKFKIPSQLSEKKPFEKSNIRTTKGPIRPKTLLSDDEKLIIPETPSESSSESVKDELSSVASTPDFEASSETAETFQPDLLTKLKIEPEPRSQILFFKSHPEKKISNDPLLDVENFVVNTLGYKYLHGFPPSNIRAFAQLVVKLLHDNGFIVTMSNQHIFTQIILRSACPKQYIVPVHNQHGMFTHMQQVIDFDLNIHNFIESMNLINNYQGEMPILRKQNAG